MAKAQKNVKVSAWAFTINDDQGKFHSIIRIRTMKPEGKKMKDYHRRPY